MFPTTLLSSTANISYLFQKIEDLTVIMTWTSLLQRLNDLSPEWIPVIGQPITVFSLYITSSSHFKTNNDLFHVYSEKENDCGIGAKEGNILCIIIKCKQIFCINTVINFRWHLKVYDAIENICCHINGFLVRYIYLPCRSKPLLLYQNSCPMMYSFLWYCPSVGIGIFFIDISNFL